MAGPTTFEDLHRLLSSLPEATFLVRKTSVSAEELAEVERDFGPPVAPVRRLLATWGVFTVEPREHVWRRIDLETIAPDQVVPSWLLENRITVLPGCGEKERPSVFNEPELLEKLMKKRAVPLLHVAGAQHLIACGEAGSFRVSWEEGPDFRVSVRKHEQPPLDTLAKAIATLRDTTAVVAPPASVLVNKMRTLRFRGKVAAQAAQALLAKPTEEVEKLIPELVAATVKTPLLRWVLDLTRQAVDKTGEIRESLIEAFGKGGRDDLLLAALARRRANDPALLPLVSEALGRTGEVVEIAAGILCTFPEGPEARALCDRVASALVEQRTEVRGQVKCLEALARQSSEYFASTLPSVLPRLPDFAYLWLLEGLAAAQDSVAPQRELLLERYRRVHPMYELDAIESLVALGIVDPAGSRSGRSRSTARSKARELVRDLDGPQLQLFLAGVSGRQLSYVRQYARALEEAQITSRYVPGPAKIARYGSAIWERARTGNRVAVPMVLKIDPADQLDALESWACFALQHIEEYVTLAQNPERDTYLDILDRILSNLEQLEDAFRSGLLRAAGDWLGPEQEEDLDARGDLARLREGSASASELHARQRDPGDGLQFNDPRFPGAWAPALR